MAGPGGVPFVSAQAPIVFGIDNGVFALRQADASERIAIAQPTIDKRQEYDRCFYPIWNGKYDFGDLGPRSVSAKSEILSTKPETNSNDQNAKSQTCCFEH
jgi:hypothetical protein